MSDWTLRALVLCNVRRVPFEDSIAIPSTLPKSPSLTSPPGAIALNASELRMFGTTIFTGNEARFEGGKLKYRL